MRRFFHPDLLSLEARRLLASSAADVLTYHNNNARTGEDLAEAILSPANVNPTQFGKLFTDAVDGAIYAQPLYMAKVAIPGQGLHNVVFVATENDSVYAFDADHPSPALWHDSFISPALGITSVPSTQPWQLDLAPQVGITGTPVIDPVTNTLYVAAKTETQSGSHVIYVYTLHALDVSTGAEKMGGPVLVQPSVPGRGVGSAKGTLTFQAQYQLQRPGLLLSNGVVYVAFGSLGDFGPYHGWIVGYAANNLAQVSVFNVTPNSRDQTGNEGGIWMSGAGPAADAAGNIYVLTGSGPFGPAALGGNFADAALKLNPLLRVTDYFAPPGTAHFDKLDLDLGSGGAILAPAQAGGSPSLLIGGGKTGTLYSVRIASMGHQQARNRSVQAIANASHSIFSSPAYFNGYVYIAAVGDRLRQYRISAGFLGGPGAQSIETYGYPGANLSVSANGSSGGIVWSLETTGMRGASGPAVLHAYLADNVGIELYNSNEAGTRDQPGAAVKFAVPTVANGKVYVGTQSGLTVYGLLS
jgi:hypothetical protein